MKVYSRDDFAFRGDVRCMPVYADNFFDMERFSITMEWNADELRLTNVTHINPLLSQGTITIDSTMGNAGIMNFRWQDTMHNFKLAPGTQLFDICFEVLAYPGTKSEITFGEDGTFFDNGYFRSDWEGGSGTITVGPDNWNVLRYYTYCYSGKDSVDITFHTIGNSPPFTMVIPEAGISQSGILSNEFTFTDFPIGEFSYRITDSKGGTHYVHNAIHIPPGTQTELSTAKIFPPECQMKNGRIKLKTMAFDFQSIRISGPDRDEIYPPKTLFEGLAPGIYTITTSDAYHCQSKPLVIPLDAKSSLDIQVVQNNSSCDQETSQVKILTLNENRDTVKTNFILDNNQVYATNFSLNITPGVHTIEVKYPEYCPVREDIMIPENPTAGKKVVLMVDNPYVSKDESFTIKAEFSDSIQLNSYKWMPRNGLQDEYPEMATFVLNTSAWISLRVTDEQGCTYSDSIYINITEDEEVEENLSLYIPNSFTPNGDGVNDQLQYYTRDLSLSIEKVKIFDRYGNIVISSNGPISDDILWNGLDVVNPTPPGVYVLMLVVKRVDHPLIHIYRTITLLK